RTKVRREELSAFVIDDDPIGAAYNSLGAAQKLTQQAFGSGGIPREAHVWREIQPVRMVWCDADFYRGVIVSAERARRKFFGRRAEDAGDVRRCGDPFHVVHGPLDLPAQAKIQGQAGLDAPAVLYVRAAHQRACPGEIDEPVVVEGVGIDDLCEAG